MPASVSPEPILANWKVNQVLTRYPQLLNVLIGASPAFAQLRNPIARRVQSRLVTVGQAARIAGIEPAALVRTLNQAIGLAAPADSEEVTDAPAKPELDLMGLTVAEELDVRPMLARGDEPFSAIMTAAKRVPAGQTLRLVASFEPVPLYAVLDKHGFRHSSRQLDAQTWEVIFQRVAADNLPAPKQPPPPMTDDAAELVQLDVSDLAPPEPMVRILAAAAKLSASQTLLVNHHRRPVYLYPQLEAQGFVHETTEIGPGRVQIRIRRAAESA